MAEQLTNKYWALSSNQLVLTLLVILELLAQEKLPTL
jgi:hypothetical protein